jgi:signal transduction histidine kinase
MNTLVDIRHHRDVTISPAPIGRDPMRTVTAGMAVLITLAGIVVVAAVDQSDGYSMPGALAQGFFVGTLAVVGVIVALAVPGNRVGWLLLTGAVGLAVGGALTELGIHGVVAQPGSIPEAGYLAALGPGLQAVGWLLTVIAVPVVFPDGRLPGPRWRWAGWCTGAAVALLLLGNVLSPTANQTRLAHWHSPLGLPGRWSALADGMSMVAVGLAVIVAGAAVVGLVARWRRGGPLLRQQVLLFAGVIVLPAGLLVAIIVTGGVPGWTFAVAGLPLPAAIMSATLGQGLYDLRRAAHRTLLWLTLSGFVVAVYAIVVLAAAAAAPDRRSWWPPAVAAVAAAGLLLPAHRAVQKAVNRIVYGRWREPYDVLADLGEQLVAAADVDRLLAATVDELTAGLDLQQVSVRSLDGALIAGCDVAADTSIGLDAYGVAVGQLCYRPSDRHLSDSEQRLLHDVARHLGGALHARALHADLQGAREQLVLAREEERRRLRRDLHDGIGPALAGLTLKTVTARRLLPPGAESADRHLAALSEEIRHVTSDVRRVVEGLRPPAIDELGLVGAISQAVDRLGADSGPSTTLCAPDSMPPLPAAVEVAAYRIAVEAVTNAVRHTRARRCHITIAVIGRELSLTVDDDGGGLSPSSRPGHGLAIMRERAEEIGGTFDARTRRDPAGTTVDARLPIVGVPAPPGRSAEAVHA